MRPQAYQTPEIRDENDSIIQQGTFGKKTPFVNSQNDGILDYIINNLEAIKGMSLAATIVVSSLPTTGQAGKFYLLDDGTENSGKVYIYKDKWVEVTTQAVGLSAYQIALKNGYEGTEQEWLEDEVYGDGIVSAETDSDGYFIVHTRQGKTIKTALKPLVDAKASADKAKTSETNSANSAATALASQEASEDSQVKAKTSETNAKKSESNAKSSENLAKAWAMSENSPDGITGNKSSKTWAVEAKASASNSASSASSSQSSATASASSASDAKVSETNAAKSATAAAQSAENAKLFDPTSYAKRSEIFPITDTGRKDIKHTITDLNDIKCISSPSWSCRDSSYVKTMSNCPTQTAFYLFNVRNGVSSASKNGTFTNLTSYYYYIIQLLLDIGGAMWVRTCFNSSNETFSFGNWKKVASINDIPTKTSQLTNDSNFATIAQLPDLTVYATKTELENGFTTASLTVSGETSVPTPSTENNSKTIANTEFVHGVVSNLVNGAPTALDTLQELASALGNDPNFATTILNKIGEKESKTDAQIEHEKLQNAIDALIKQPLQGNTVLWDHLHRFGFNPTLPTTNAELNKLGVFISYISGEDKIANQPTLYGQLINLPADRNNELAQLWIEQYTGKMFYRGGNGLNPINDIPFKRFLDENDATALNAKIPTKVSQLTDDVGIAKISNGHLVINGSELWIE